jgi:hypothetical protein
MDILHLVDESFLRRPSLLRYFYGMFPYLSNTHINLLPAMFVVCRRTNNYFVTVYIKRCVVFFATGIGVYSSCEKITPYMECF